MKSIPVRKPFDSLAVRSSYKYKVKGDAVPQCRQKWWEIWRDSAWYFLLSVLCRVAEMDDFAASSPDLADINMRSCTAAKMPSGRLVPCEAHQVVFSETSRAEHDGYVASCH